MFLLPHRCWTNSQLSSEIIRNFTSTKQAQCSCCVSPASRMLNHAVDFSQFYWFFWIGAYLWCSCFLSPASLALSHTSAPAQHLFGCCASISRYDALPLRRLPSGFPTRSKSAWHFFWICMYPSERDICLKRVLTCSLCSQGEDKSHKYKTYF